MNRFVVLVAGLLASLSVQAEAPMTAPDLSCYQPQPYVRLQHPEWTKNAVLYQVNLRQFTPEGTLAAAEKQLPRIKELGADIVWLMPIHPIGVKNRKGTLGSPYAVRDYFDVNPEFGSRDDLKRFVKRAHELGLYVILDWVANHTSWDNVLVAQHPEWYERDWKGDFHPSSWWDWSDIIELDYNQPGLRQYMTEALKYWVRETGIDGYRCDVAGYVPVDFWNNARKELDAIKPVFMLAEWETAELHAEAFDATYAWAWNQAAHHATAGGKGVPPLRTYYSQQDNAWPREAMRMMYITNHDVNAWEGTETEMFGPGLEAVTVLSVVSAGIPLLHNGQEAGLDRRLAFFEKDPIAWKEHPRGELYRRLFALKKANPALWNGQWGARMIDVPNSAPGHVLSFVRQNEGGRVFAAFNFSGKPQAVKLSGTLQHGSYVDFATGKTADLRADSTVELPAWGWLVYTR